jgi:hypothetical protein
VLNHQTDIFEVPEPGLRVPEPKTLGVIPDQRPRTLDEFRRRGRRGGNFLQGFRPIIHAATLRMFRDDRKNGVLRCLGNLEAGRNHVEPVDSFRDA